MYFRVYISPFFRVKSVVSFGFSFYIKLQWFLFLLTVVKSLSSLKCVLCILNTIKDLRLGFLIRELRVSRNVEIDRQNNVI